MDKGYENRVYDSEDALEIRNVLKIIDIPEDWTHIFYSDLSEIFERIVIHNCIFNNATLNIIGFANANGVLKVIIEQLFFKGETPTATEIATYIKSKINDIHPILDFHHNEDFYIGDLHDRNVIKDKKGNIIVIDCMLAFNDNDSGLRGLGKIYDETHSPIFSTEIKLLKIQLKMRFIGHFAG